MLALANIGFAVGGTGRLPKHAPAAVEAPAPFLSPVILHMWDGSFRVWTTRVRSLSRTTRPP